MTEKSACYCQFLITNISSASLKFGECYLIRDVFIIFISFFDEVQNFWNRILTNQNLKLVMWNCIKVRKPCMTLWKLYRKNWAYLKCSSDSHFCHPLLYISFICIFRHSNVFIYCRC